ncbi:MAG: hypothetical protein WB492_13830 [Christiangramia sp.]
MILKLSLLLIYLCFSANLISQEKLRQPSEIVGIKHIDSVVAISFNLYNLLIDYEKRVDKDEILSEEDLCQIENILSNSENIIQAALAAKAHFKNENIIIKTKATIHLERAKRALYYCKKTSEEILLAEND